MMLRIVLFFNIFASIIFAQSATIQTIARATGASSADVPNGKYNILAGVSNGWRITVSSFQSDGRYRVYASNTNHTTGFTSVKDGVNPGTSFNIDVTETNILDGGKSTSNNQNIWFKIQSLNSSGGLDDGSHYFLVTTAGGANNNGFYIDKVRPVVSSVDDQYVKSGATVTVTGSGFTDGGTATAQATVNGVGYDITVNSNTQLQITVGAGNFRNTIIVTDLAGNKNITGAQLTVDNSAPVVSSVNKNSIKNGGNAAITGNGFLSSPASPIASVKVNNATTGIANFNVDTDTQITLTATTGNVAHSVIKVTDEAGNSSTATNVKIAIDNTAPSISSITDTDGNAKSLGKSGDQIEVRGNNFVLTGTDDSVVKFAGQTTSDLGITVNSITNAKITLTLGNTEVSGAQVTVTDEAENVGAGGNFTIDNTKPTVSSVGTQFIKNGATSIITGSGFTTNGDASGVKLGSTLIQGGNASYTVNSNTQITITGAGTDFTNQNVVVVDAAGNESTDSGKLLTIDPTRPNITGIQGSAPYIIKSGATVQINGDNNKFTTGSGTSSAEVDANILINDTWPTGMTATVSGNAVVITAGAGEVNGAVKIKDRAGNEHTNAGPVVIDNTAPVVNSIGPDTDNDKLVHLKSDGTITILGSGFTNSGIASSDGSVKLESDDWASTYGSVTVNNDGQITLANGSGGDASGRITVLDFAGNETTVSDYTIFVDNTKAVSTNISVGVVKQGVTAVLTGTGFKNGDAESTITIGGQNAGATTFTYTVDSGTQITITGGSGDINDGAIVVTDPAGNVSTTNKKLTVDNTKPSVSSVATATIKNGATSVITGSGFFTQVDGVNDGTDLNITVGGSTPAGMTWVVNSNTQITITAGAGEVTEGNIVVTDRAGNASTETGKLLTIDNTAPELRGVTVSSIKSSGETTLSGTGFLVGGDIQNIKVGGSVPTGMTYKDVTANSIVITAGNGEVADGLVTVTDAAGNTSTSLVYLTIDNTLPTISGVGTAAIKSGQTSVISGAGFKNTTNNSNETIVIQEIYVDGSRPAGLTWAVNSANQLTITAGAGEVTNKNITVKDSAGNWSTSNGQFLTIDNTAPELTNITDRWIKNGESTVINGSGFQSFGGDASAVTIGGKDLATAVGSGGLGGSFTVNSDTKITVTAGSGEVTRGLVTVTDAVGNVSNAIKAISIDNTRPAAPEKLWLWYSDTGTDEDNVSNDSTPFLQIKGVSSSDSITVKVTKAGTANNAAWLGKPSSSNGTQYLTWEERTNEIMANPGLEGYDRFALLTNNAAPTQLTDNGVYTFTAFAVDSAGNESSSGAIYKYTFDNIAPDEASLSLITPETNFGQSDTDWITNSKRPAFVVTNVPAGHKIRLYTDDPDDVGVGKFLTLVDDTTRSVPATIVVAEDLPHDQVLKKVNGVDVFDSDGIDRYYRPVVIDTAGNSTTGVLQIVEIDQVRDTASITYGDNPVWSGDNTVDISVKFTDNMNTVTAPKLDIYWPGDVTPTIENAAMTQGSTDSSWTYQLNLIDDKTGNVRVIPNAFDKAGNYFDQAATQDTLTLFLDNTPPDSSKIGLITAFGDTSVTGWFNDYTDSLKFLVPLNASDSTLLRGGKLRIESNVRAKLGENTWRIVRNNAGSVEDSIVQRGNNVPIVRSRQSILSSLDGTLFQGDTIRFRATVFDKAGNSTSGEASESVFVLDTIPPGERPFINDTLFTQGNTKSFLTINRDTTWTNDTLRFAWLNWPDSVLVNERPSGLSYYQYSVYQSTKKDPGVNDWTLWRNFKKIAQDTLVTSIDSLRHDRKYYTAVVAVDTAGNRSDTVRSSITLRQNVEPVISAINDTTVKEDIEWKRLVEVKDDDAKTLLGDSFTYQLITMAVDTIKKDSSVIQNLNDDAASKFKAKISTSGELTFTPSPLDSTGKDTLYLFRVVATDAWTKDDTFDINVKVLPVNDNPIIDLSSYTKFSSWGYKEGARSDSIPLTRYVFDEDNDTTDLIFTFKIIGSSQNNPGYPTAKLGFLSPVSSGFKKKFLTDLVDEYPKSTIMQKNNSFLVYPPGVTNLKDPVKVDSTSKVGDVFTDTTYAWIMPTDTTTLDTNYYTIDSMRVEFTVIDPGGLTGKDTIPFFINPKNDPPVWSGLRDTVVIESDSLSLDFANYLTDTDDTLLTVSILPLTYASKVDIKTPKDSIRGDTVFYISRGRNEPVFFKPQALWYDYKPANVPGDEGVLRAGQWNPSDTSSNKIQFEITAADDSGSVATDTFSVKIQRVPRPEIRMYVVQNNAFTDYYEIFLVDSLATTTDISLKVQSEIIRLDTAAAYTYVGNHYIRGSVLQREFDIYAKGTVGDTTLPTKIITFTLAKTYGNWSGSSADGRFGVLGRNGSVDYDQTLMILDSSLFEPYFNDQASYLLGNESSRFKKSVQVSLLTEEDELAIYQRSIGSGWIELASYNENGQIMAYTDKMGYFRVGPKTMIVPGQTSLHQNYPNPFNPTTTIEYDLGFIDGPTQRVNITVYDILGRNIKTLINEQQNIGRYRVKWNGKDQNDVPVSSGIYFVNLLTDTGRSETKKIMLMR